MTAACREACCSVTARFSAGDLFERGFRRNREAPLAIEGAATLDPDGNAARFSVDIAGGKLLAVNFRATTCATLIAYCELIAELVPGMPADMAEQLSARDLVEGLPGVPPLKHARASLAVDAFRAALAAHVLEPTGGMK